MSARPCNKCGGTGEHWDTVRKRWACPLDKCTTCAGTGCQREGRMNAPRYDKGGFIPPGASWARNTSGVSIAIIPFKDLGPADTEGRAA